jgi:predicted MFS family arabinose efflux permease
MLSSGFAVASIGGLGLLYGLYPHAYFAVAIGVVLTVLIIGFCHGAINAPVVTLVANSDSAQQYGAASVASYYRFSERVGHVLGPLLVGQVLLLSGGKTEGLLYVGGALILLALLFAVTQSSRADTTALVEAHE